MNGSKHRRKISKTHTSEMDMDALHSQGYKWQLGLYVN